MIPKVIMQTSRWEPNIYRVLKIKEICPGYDYVHFTDKDIINLFESNPNPIFSNIIDVFRNTTAGPHKADLFRYYYLYYNGGVYMDTDLMPHVHLDNIIKDYKFVSVTTTSNKAFNGFIGTVPKHRIMFLCLRHAYYTLQKNNCPDYHAFCKEFMTIVNMFRDSSVNMELTEHIKLETSEIKNHAEEHVLTHYFKKVFPVTFLTRSDDYVDY